MRGYSELRGDEGIKKDGIRDKVKGVSGGYGRRGISVKRAGRTRNLEDCRNWFSVF